MTNVLPANEPVHEIKIPRLDYRSLNSGNKFDQIQFIGEFYQGLKDYGFIVLQNTPLKIADIDQAYMLMKDLFELPLELKEKYSLVKGGGQRGFTKFGVEHAKDNDLPDLKEFWHIGRQLPDEHILNAYYPVNIWPDEIRSFKKIFLQIYSTLDQISMQLLESLTVALDAPSNYFSDMVYLGNSILRLIHYPPLKEIKGVQGVRAAAHGDINLITILPAATCDGLQLLGADGKWLGLNAQKGELIVDSGDMLSRITNDSIPTTVHRVVNPDINSTSRYSMPFFVHPNPTKTLSCIPSCVGKGMKYPDINAHEFLMTRLHEIGLYENQK